ncbi:MAG: hypothetical protein LJE95_07250 [Acidobacteria bacterium]|nr:hypothetical protein [Acidobacteriota bacterium]
MLLRRLVTLLLLMAAPAAAGRVDPALLQDLHWRLIGPFRGGRVLAVTGVPSEPDHFYFGSVNGGVWETVDAGRTWRPIFDRVPVGSIGALAVAPSNPKVIYAGTGEADMRSDIAQGKGVYASSDGGKTWRFAGLGDSQQIGRIEVDPRDPSVVWVAALGHPYGPNEQRGIFKSTDGGKSWRKVLGPDEDTGGIELVLAPDDPDTVYAALWQTRRPPWSVYPPSNGPGSGLYKSTDGGKHWQKIEGHGFPKAPGRIGLAVAPSEPSRVYALVDADDGGGLYRSDDRGAHWTTTSTDTRVWYRGWYFGQITVEPRDADVVYVCNTVLLRSADGGKTFVPIEGDATGDDFHQMWINPKHPERRILGTDQGTIVSVDDGASWSSWYNQPTAQLYHIAADNRFPFRVYAAQQDSGSISLPSRTMTWDGISPDKVMRIPVGGESQNLAPDPLDPDIIYGGTVDRLDLRTWQARSIDPTVAHPDRWRRTWTLPLAFSFRDPRVLYFARQKIFRTDDGGNHWEIISPDLTRHEPGALPNLDPITAKDAFGLGPRRGVVYALAPSHLADHELWAGTDDGLVWRTRDGGQHWQNVTPPELTPWSKVGIIETSHFDPQTAYVAVDRHRLDDRKPYIYRTHDGGQSWQLTVDGIASDHFVNAVREDPAREGLLYAATEEGVYFSLDDGDHWQSLQLNLPVTSVRDLVVHGDDLAIATHGRGIWILDDVAPLRQLTAEVEAAPVWLFKPATAYRLRFAGFTGTPMPKDEPTAPNPPAGAWIDYLLKTAPAGPVTLEIRDAAGAVVDSWSSADKVRSPDPRRMRMAPQWFEPPAHIEATPGMHRFVWNLRYSSSPGVGGFRYRGGVWAPPGEYTVVLTVDGSTLTRTLTVAPDPRVKLEPAAYREEFELARRVETLASRVAKTERAVAGVQRQLRARQREARGEVAAALDGLSEKLTALTGVEPRISPANIWFSPPKSVDSLRWLSGTLRELLQVVDGADAAPSADARAAYAKLEPMVNSAVGVWRRISATDLAALNEKLAAAGMKAITTRR